MYNLFDQAYHSCFLPRIGVFKWIFGFRGFSPGIGACSSEGLDFGFHGFTDFVSSTQALDIGFTDVPDFD